MNRKEVDNVQIEQIGRSAAMVFPMQREAVNTPQRVLTGVEPRLDGTESFIRGPAPVFPGLRPATTSMFDCYKKPICSAA
uniref:Uncharacterized protein n=1 Tax=Timema cristinae TaxID=61476 RepID=A0A7R9HF20_TIMCR|nr:unnamed protein product [Timema cristinae]